MIELTELSLHLHKFRVLHFRHDKDTRLHVWSHPVQEGLQIGPPELHQLYRARIHGREPRIVEGFRPGHQRADGETLLVPCWERNNTQRLDGISNILMYV